MLNSDTRPAMRRLAQGAYQRQRTGAQDAAWLLPGQARGQRQPRSNTSNDTTRSSTSVHPK
ncbi:hypothetical protein, partial [Chromohalobacter sp. HP20-39]|uniref:hypothetical protein n=1 Tax=Chromohalobacter sp. HP20-39 TaxID=3079306 RepID=UPI00294ADA9B